MVGSKREAGTCAGVLLSLYRGILALPALLRWSSDPQVLDADPDVTSPSRVQSHSHPPWMPLALVRTTLSSEGAGVGGHLVDGGGLPWGVAARSWEDECFGRGGRRDPPRPSAAVMHIAGMVRSWEEWGRRFGNETADEGLERPRSGDAEMTKNDAVWAHGVVADCADASDSRRNVLQLWPGDQIAYSLLDM